MTGIESPPESTLTLGTAAKEYDGIEAAVSEHQILQPVKQTNTTHTVTEHSKENMEHISQPEFVAAVVTTTPLAIETTMKDPMLAQHSLPDSINLPRNSNLTSSANEFTSKQESPISSTRTLHSDRPMELKKSAHNTDAYNCDPALTYGRRAEESSPPIVSGERKYLMSKLSEKALAAIYIVPKTDVEAILTQAVALKLSAKLITGQNDNDPNALIILDHEEEAFRTLLRAAMTSEDVKAKAGMLNVSTTLRASAAAVVAGAIGVWAALAFA